MGRKFKDLTGMKFGRLTVIERAGRNKQGCITWLCKCECGNTKIIVAADLLRGHTQSCGCINQESKDLTGKKFHRLLAIKPTRKNSSRQWYWLCQCDCGSTIEVLGVSLTSGHTKSCGCFNHDNHVTHNLSYDRVYKIYWGMKQRCYNTNHQAYKNYGGRNIKICNEWLNDFMSFYNWAINNGYKEGLTIDRIDVNGNYEPSNCMWVTMKVQNNNRRNNHLITYKGETLPVALMAEKYNINRSTLYMRLNKSHWSVEKAIETPVNKNLPRSNKKE